MPKIESEVLNNVTVAVWSVVSATATLLVCVNGVLCVLVMYERHTEMARLSAGVEWKSVRWSVENRCTSVVSLDSRHSALQQVRFSTYRISHLHVETYRLCLSASLSLCDTATQQKRNRAILEMLEVFAHQTSHQTRPCSRCNATIFIGFSTPYILT